ncbi:hypothetical protein ALQ20_200143 [Pseudomonas syringae pv. atrofaciens]|nr:hypothetical protein ALQ20_200143 [Pseudomonas syringae pv. atrofaciens]
MPVLTAGIEHQVSPVTFMGDVRQLGWQRELSPQPEQGVAHIPHPAMAHRLFVKRQSLPDALRIQTTGSS